MLPYISAFSSAAQRGGSYVKRFFQVVARAGTGKRAASFLFSLYDRPVWPLRTVYLFAVLVLVLVSARAAWSTGLLPRSPLVFSALGAIPMIPLFVSISRMEGFFRRNFPRAGP